MKEISRIFNIFLVLSVFGILLGITSRNETIRPAPKPLEFGAFEEVPTGVVHRWQDGTHPFSGAAIIDADGDGRPEIFVGGGEDQDDWLLTWREGKLTDIAGEAGVSSKSATHRATAIDLDRDGDTDLAVARRDGVYLLLNDAGKFAATKVPVELGADTVPFSVAVGDVNSDDHADLYVSAFMSFPAFRSATFDDLANARKNVLLLNNGDLTFTDITESSGTVLKQNPFTSAFVDLDGNRRQDLVLSQNTGEVELFRNTRDGTFEPVATNTGDSFWMGLAVGDVDADGDQDLLFSNLNVSIPTSLTRGDLTEGQRHAAEWLLLRNNGDSGFSDVTANYGLHGYGSSWGTVFEDLNLDGRLDLAVAQNYTKCPLHKIAPLGSKAFLQHDDAGKPGFNHCGALGPDNRHFVQLPLIADLNGDGRADFLWLNMHGQLRAFLNRSQANFVAFAVPTRCPSSAQT